MTFIYDTEVSETLIRAYDTGTSKTLTLVSCWGEPNPPMWLGGTENAGLENAGLENAGTSFVWVGRCNVITVLR